MPKWKYIKKTPFSGRGRVLFNGAVKEARVEGGLSTGESWRPR